MKGGLSSICGVREAGWTAAEPPGEVDDDPQAWLADVLGRIASHPAQRLAELLPWNWKPTSAVLASLDAAA